MDASPLSEAWPKLLDSDEYLLEHETLQEYFVLEEKTFCSPAILHSVLVASPDVSSGCAPACQLTCYNCDLEASSSFSSELELPL